MTGRSTYAGAGESAGVDWEQIGNKLSGEFHKKLDSIYTNAKISKYVIH
jgi:hypothetical protein